MDQYKGKYTAEEKEIIEASRKRTLELLSQTTNSEAAKELGVLITMMVGEFVTGRLLEPADINIIFTAVNEAVLKGSEMINLRHPQTFSEAKQSN